MSDAEKTVDFYGHQLQEGDIAAALLQLDNEGGMLALVRVIAVGGFWAQVKLLHDGDALLASSRVDKSGFVPFRTWARNLIWHTSDLAQVPDTYVHDILNVQRES